FLTRTFGPPMRRLPATAFFLAGALLAGPVASAAQAPGPVTVRTAGGVTVVADRIEQVAPDNLVVATGNVELTRGTARLLADRVVLPLRLGHRGSRRTGLRDERLLLGQGRPADPVFPVLRCGAPARAPDRLPAAGVRNVEPARVLHGDPVFLGDLG